MQNPLQSRFAAVFQAEVLLSSKRIAPYVLILIFTAHSVLWWGWSAAATYGWATNGDFNIVRNLQGFSFLLGLPIFNAVIMCDPVIRDFRLGMDPLIFSKPVGRASYLLGKFCGNFFVLVCCQSAFALTMMLLQWVSMSGLVVGPTRVFPYFKHFFFFVVVSHLFLAVVYFTVGTLTRNAKIVYGLAVAFYPVYIAYQVVLLKNLPGRWSQVLDPMLLGTNAIPPAKWADAAWVNQLVVTYSSDMIANRVLVIAAAATGLLILCFRFSIAAGPERAAGRSSFSLLDLSGLSASVTGIQPAAGIQPVEGIQFAPGTFDFSRSTPSGSPTSCVSSATDNEPLPKASGQNDGVRANLKKLFAATQLELYLLGAERSLIVLMPLAVFLSFLSLPFSAGVSEVSPSAAFARSTTQGALLFLLGVIVFYVGEAMHRDREARIEPVLWSAPAPNYVFLISKFLATLVLALVLLCLIGLTAVLTQILRGRAPIEVSTYLLSYSIILAPGLAFMAAAGIALNLLLRDKYTAYAVIIAASSGLFYLYIQGYDHWLYNPVLYGLWTEADLVSSNAVARILLLRIYCLAITLLCLWLAQVCFERKSGSRYFFSTGSRKS